MLLLYVPIKLGTKNSEKSYKFFVPIKIGTKIIQTKLLLFVPIKLGRKLNLPPTLIGTNMGRKKKR